MQLTATQAAVGKVARPCSTNFDRTGIGISKPSCAPTWAPSLRVSFGPWPPHPKDIQGSRWVGRFLFPARRMRMAWWVPMAFPSFPCFPCTASRLSRSPALAQA